MEIATAISLEMDALDPDFFSSREVCDVTNTDIEKKKLIYYNMSDGIIVPCFKLMNKLNTV